MFANTIATTALCSEAANDVLGYISGDYIFDDRTFVSTMRALLSERAKGEEVTLRYYEKYVGDESIDEAEDSDTICRKIIGRTVSEHTIKIVNIVGRGHDSWAAKMDEKVKNWNGFSRMQDVTDFYIKAFRVICLVNRETKSVVLATDNMDIRRMHYLQCSILAFMPWYFNPKDGISELEMKIVNSLRSKSPDDYLACIQEFADKFDFRTNKIRKQLDGFETRDSEAVVERLKSLIERLDNEVSGYKRRIIEKVAEIRDKTDQINGIMQRIRDDDGSSELMDYFIQNKNLELAYASGREISFITKGYLDFYDEDMAERVIKNSRSDMYRMDSPLSKQDIESLMTAVFLDRKIRMRVCASFNVNFDGSVEANSHYHYPPEYDTYMPNPHLHHYSCLGDNERLILEKIDKNDNIGVIAQCESAARSINFGDSAVMNQFCASVVKSGYAGYKTLRVFELPDGTIVDPAGAIKWIKEQEA